MIDYINDRNAFSQEYNEQQIQKRVDSVLKSRNILFEHINTLISYKSSDA